MKKIVIIMAIAAIGLTSCSKEDDFVTQNITSSTEISNADSLNYRFDFDCPTLCISYRNLHPYDVKTLLGEKDTPIGKVFYFESNGDNFTVIYDWNGNHTTGFITGNINNHSFIGFEQTINICSGPQQVPYIFTLYNSNGSIVDSNSEDQLDS